MKPGILDKLISRIDQLGAEEIQHVLARLTRENGIFENVFQALREGVIIVDNKGIILFSNHASSVFFGIDSEQAIGSQIQTQIRGLIWHELAHPNATVSRDLEIFYPENRFLNFYVSPILPEEKPGHGLPSESSKQTYSEPIGHVLLVRDITVQKRELEQELETEKLNAVTLLAAGVAHEIGNPLNSLGIHMQLLARKTKKLSGSQSAELLSHIETANIELKRLDEILKQFLSAIRPTKLQKSLARLGEVLHESLAVIEPELSQRKISVALNLEKPLPPVEIDVTQFKQAFFNLLKNAAQAVADKNGQISIEACSSEQEIIVSISDNGEGIPPDVMRYLFEPFHTMKKSGTGLGLLIVRRIVREHGGEIEISSEIDRGTRVTIHLPRFEKQIRQLSAPSDIIEI